MIKIRRNFKGSGGKPRRTKEGGKQRNLFYLRKFRKIKSHPAKMGSSCEKILQAKEPSYEKLSQAKDPSCEKFHRFEPPPRHTCAISQPSKPISQLRNKLRNPQSIISQAKGPKLRNFLQLRTTL